MSLPRSPTHSDLVALVLADSLLLCVLQEALPDPSPAHIQALLSRLEVKMDGGASNPLREAKSPPNTAASGGPQPLLRFQALCACRSV